MTGPTQPVREALGRVADGVGLTELQDIEARLGRLEEAVAENTRLSGPLERYVSRIEADLVPLLERSTATEADTETEAETETETETETEPD